MMISVTSSPPLKEQGFLIHRTPSGSSTGLNSTQSVPTTLLPSPRLTLRGTGYGQLTCIPDLASLKVDA